MKQELTKVKLGDVFTRNKETGQIFLGGELITEAELANLRQEVSMLETMRVWSILQNTTTDIARLKMFEKAESFEDMRWGKALLYVRDLDNQICKFINS